MKFNTLFIALLMMSSAQAWADDKPATAALPIPAPASAAAPAAAATAAPATAAPSAPAAAPATAVATSPDSVVLKVGGDTIKRAEIDDIWKSIFPGGNPPPFDTFDEKVRNNVLRGVASEHVVYKEAEKSGIENTPEVKERIAAATRQIIIQDFLKQKTQATLSDDKLKELYADHVKTFAANAPEEVHARHILVKTEAEAKDIEKKLKKGGDFAKLAKEKSEDKGSGAAGGDLGWFTADKMVPEFSKAAFALKVGEISAPVKSDFGWHIIQVEDRRKSTAPSFEEMKDSLRQEAGNKAVGDYVASLMKDMKVTVVDANGKESELPMGPAAVEGEKK